MSMLSAPRWVLRHNNLIRALAQLDDAIALNARRPLSQLERQGLIQAFEFTYELAWTTLKDYLEWQGITGLVGSRDTIREAFARGLIADGQQWMDMLSDRNRKSHTYHEGTALAIVEHVIDHYQRLFHQLRDTLARKIPSASQP
ncbi:nucleotidyltransferase substrate binding protein [Fontimonas sp. SYSU GA230001]|uniref:nucleotidyltransferase substrate binding protein n=1 Tax=Fontimonas sp. SYSU GA230001 TaxID=3142450 RepID=UPI0032B3DF11